MSSLLDKIKALESSPEHSLNTLVALADINAADINQLDGVLAAKGVKVGDSVGAGGTAIIFELENKEGRKIPSAVLRIESKGISGNSKHPFVLQPVASYESAEHVAHIMPRAEKLVGTVDATNALKTIAALRTQDELEEAWDLKPDALMQIKKPDGQLVSYADGSPVLIVADSNAVGSASVDGDVDISSVIARAFSVDKSQVANATLPDSDIQHVQAQMQAISDSVKADVQRAGITIPDSWQARTAGRAGRHLG